MSLVSDICFSSFHTPIKVKVANDRKPFDNVLFLGRVHTERGQLWHTRSVNMGVTRKSDRL